MLTHLLISPLQNSMLIVQVAAILRRETILSKVPNRTDKAGGFNWRFQLSTHVRAVSFYNFGK